MSVFQSPLFTRKFTDADSPYVLPANTGITKWSIKLVSGAATLKGSRKIGNLESTAIDLVEEQAVNASDENGNCCFELVIEAGGIVDFIAA